MSVDSWSQDTEVVIVDRKDKRNEPNHATAASWKELRL